jgi:hypothetical protein
LSKIRTTSANRSGLPLGHNKSCFAGGETVLVTDRDRVVAELGPPSPTRSPLLSDAVWFDACRQGWVRPPILIGREPPPRKPVMKIAELLSWLHRDRADR